MSSRPSSVIVVPYFPEVDDDDEDPTLLLSTPPFAPPSERGLSFAGITRLGSFWGRAGAPTTGAPRLPPIDVEGDPTSSMRAPRKKRLPRPPPLPRPKLVVHYDPPSPLMLPLLLAAAGFLGAGVIFFILFIAP